MQNPLKIIRIAAVPTEETPGAGIAAYKLSETEKFDTQLFTYSYKSKILNEKKIRPYKINFPNPTMPKNRKGFKFIYLQMKRIYAVVTFFISFLLNVDSKRVDIVHVHTPMHFLIIWWSNFKKIPTFLSIHGSDYHRIIESKFYRILLGDIRNINCVSQSDIYGIQKAFPNAKVNLISNGVDRELFVSENQLDYEDTILGIGTLRWQKDFKSLIKAFDKLTDIHDSWKLKIIGEGDERESLMQLISDLGKEDKIFLMGSLSRHELSKELKKAKIFVLSSVTEGLPKALLEAMSAKCACISTDVGDCKRVIGDNGIVVNKEDTDALSYAMSELMGNNDLIDYFALKASDESKKYTWQAYIEKHEALYKQEYKLS